MASFKADSLAADSVTKSIEPYVTKESSGSSSASPGVLLVHGDSRGFTKWKTWLAGEAGTPLDGWLLTVSSQIGQIMLTLPNAMAKVGVAAAIPIAVATATMSLWTMYLLITLYVERKALLVAKGLWYDEAGGRKAITQYHEVIGDLLGKWARYLVIAVISVSLFGTCVAQIVASSADAYYYSEEIDKRTWSIIWGGIMMLTPLLPSFRHFRIINIIGIIGTTFTAWYIVGVSAAHGEEKGHVHWTPVSLANFYVGISVFFSAFGCHAMALEIMDSMFRPEKYDRVYFGGFLYIFTLTLPHSISVNVAFPDRVFIQGNVFGSVPQSGWRKASIILMLIHQVCAFAYYSAPLYYLWEKFLHVHESPYWIRIPLRYPIALGVFAFAVAFPFYGTLNSVIGAITAPCIAFIFPALAYTWWYRKKERRDACKFLPPRWMMPWGSWNAIFLFNVFIVLLFLVNGTGFGIYFSVKQFVHDVRFFSVFPKCYQC